MQKTNPIDETTRATRSGNPIPVRALRSASNKTLSNWALWTCSVNAQAKTNGKPNIGYAEQTLKRIVAEAQRRDS